MKSNNQTKKSNSKRNTSGPFDKFRALPDNVKFWLFGGSGLLVVTIAAVLFGTPFSAPPLIQLGVAPGGSENSSSIVPEASEDKMMMPYSTYEYLAGSELSSETGTGKVYRLVRTGNPESVLTKLAGVFGIDGSVRPYPDSTDQNPGYFLGTSEDPWASDNQNPIISVWWTGSGSWNYYSSASETISSSTCLEQDADGICLVWDEVSPTPELLPTREESIAKALEIFNATGLPATESDLKVDYSEWGVFISAGLKVEGQPTSIEWYIGWSSTGEISYAGGHSVVAEEVGTFETISAVRAVDRLKDWRWFGSAATFYYDKYFDPSSGSNARTDQMVEPEVPEGEVIPEPETVTLKILTAEKALVTIWDASGMVWLVPGLIMVNDQGWFDSVISLVEGVIALPDPSMLDIEPLPADDSSVSNK